MAPVTTDPVVDLINNSLDEFRRQLNFVVAYAQPPEFSVRLAALLGSQDAPNRLVYDGQNVTANYLAQILAPFRECHLGLNVVCREWQAFLDRLPILTIRETGGIEALNSQIAALIGQLKASVNDPTIDAQTVAEKLSHLLYSLIHLCPHVARSIELCLAPIYGSAEFHNTFAEVSGGRGAYERFRSVLGAASPEAYPADASQITIRRPLPFPLMGEVIACDRLSIRKFSKGKPVIMSAIGISIEAPVVTFDMSWFSIEEVVSLRLSDSTDYTPWIHDREGLVPVPKWELWYLRFRQFFQLLSTYDELPAISEADRSLLRTAFLQPEHQDLMWRIDWPITGQKTLRHGFLAYANGETNEFALYELVDVKDQTRPELFLAAHHGRLKQGVTVYRGRTLIERLLRVPRHFVPHR